MVEFTPTRLAGRRRIPVAMTIAGSDSGGGAGIEADLKTFSALGVHGTAAITSVTAQNTLTVSAIHDLPGWMVYEQIRVVHEDIGVDAAKTGMLSNAEIIASVARAVEDFNIRLVVDPVMVAKSGARLLREDAVDALKKQLLPLALAVTPNAFEAEILAGFKVESVEDAGKAAETIHEKYGVPAVIVKGGHLKHEEVVDVLYYNGEYHYLRSQRFPHGCFHGAGCAFSAAIAAFLAKGYGVVEAVKAAKNFIDLAIDYGVKIGKGHCPVNPSAFIEIPALKYRALESVRHAVEVLLEKQELVLPYTPREGISIAEAISPLYARSVDDVAGVEGGVVEAGGRLVRTGDVKPGGSPRLATLVLALRRAGCEVGAAVSVRYAPEVVEAASRRGFKTLFVEPGEGFEGLIERVASQIPAGRDAPDLICCPRGVSGEGLIVVLAESAVEAVGKLLAILGETG